MGEIWENGDFWEIGEIYWEIGEFIGDENILGLKYFIENGGIIWNWKIYWKLACYWQFIYGGTFLVEKSRFFWLKRRAAITRK